MKVNLLVTLVLLWQLVCPTCVWAEAVDLDLNSTAASHSADQMLSDHGATAAEISVGGNVRTVTPGSLLTPAELLAVHQVLSSGQQSLAVGSAGNAVGGSFTVDALLSDHLQSLVIPQGVTAIRDFGSTAALNLTGNLVNAGNLFAISSNSQVTTAAISALNIVNQQGAVLSSVLPADGLAGFSPTVLDLSLSLHAVESIVNSGTISSAGNLSMMAGGAIINNTNAVVQAAGSVNLASQLGQFVNSGLIAASLGNVNFATGQFVRDMVLNGTGGTIQALAGSINFRDQSFLDKANLSIIGGDLISRELNLYGGQGTVEVDAGQIAGVVNSTAHLVRVSASDGDGILNIGTVTATDDPFMYSSGVLNITSDISGGQITLVAADDINISSNVVLQGSGNPVNIISGKRVIGGSNVDISSGSGTNILILAGAAFDCGGTCSGSSGTVNVTGGSTTGGNVDLGTALRVSTTASNAGVVRVGAWGGSTYAGDIALSNVFARSNAATNGNGGAIEVIGAGNITLSNGTIYGRGTGTAGSLYLATAAPQPSSLSVNTSTGVVSGTINVSGLTNKDVSVGSVTAIDTTDGTGGSGGSISILAGNSLTLSGTIGGSAFSQTSSAAVNLTANGAGTVMSQTGGGIVTTGQLTATLNNSSGVANLTSASNNVGSLSGSGGIGSTINVDNGSNPIQLRSFAPGQNVNVTTSGAITTDTSGTMSLGSLTLSGGSITLTKPISASGAVNLTASGDITTPHAIVNTISAGDGPYGVAVNSSGTRAYVANALGDTVSVIDTASNGVLATVNVGDNPVGVAVNAAGTRVYVANGDSGNISIIDTATNTVVGTVSLGGDPFAVAVHPSGSFVYVSNRTANTVQVINTTSNTVVATVNVGTTPRGVAVHPAGTHVYVANINSNTVSVIDTSTNTVTATINVGSQPEGIAANPAGTFLYVGNKAGNSVSVIDMRSNTVVTTVAVGAQPIGVAVDPAGTFAYVAQWNSNTVSIIDTATNTVVGNFTVGSVPQALGSFVGFVGDNVTAYVSNRDSDSVSIIRMPAITAPVMSLASTSGTITVATNAGTLSATTSGAGKVMVTERDAVTIGASTAGGTLFVGSAGTIATSGAVSAGLVNLQSTLANGTVTVGANLTGTNGVTLTTVGGSSKVLQTGGQISLPNGGLVLNTPQLGDSSSAVNITSAQALTFSLPIVANTVSLSTTANNGSITFNGNVTAGTGVTVTTHGSGNISAPDSLVASIAVGLLPAGVALNAAGTRAYVSNRTSDTVSVIDLATSTVIATVPVGDNPQGIVVLPNGSFVYVANSLTNNVSVINTTSNTVVATVPVGAIPRGIAVHPSGSFVYVANKPDNSVSVIDTATNTVTATITVGTGPVQVTVTPDGTRAYVANQTGGTVSVIDTATNAVIATIAVGNLPTGMAVHPAGDRAYVTNYQDSTVSVIDTATNSVIATVPTGSNPMEVSFNPAGTFAYVVNRVASNVTVIDAASNQVVNTVPIGGLIASIGSGTGFVGNNIRTYIPVDTGHVKVLEKPVIVAPTVTLSSTSGNIDVATNVGAGGLTVNTGGNATITERDSIGVGASTVGGTFVLGAAGTTTTTAAIQASNVIFQSPQAATSISIGNSLTGTSTVSLYAGGSISAAGPISAGLDVSLKSRGDITTPHTVVATVPVGSSPEGVAANNAGTLVYVTNWGSNTVSVIDTATNTVSATIPVGNNPQGIALKPDGSRAYVVNWGNNTVSVVDTSTNAVIATIPVGTSPQKVAVHPDGTFVYVTNNHSSSNSVSVISTATNTVVATVPVGMNPQGVAVHPAGTFVYVANSNTLANSVSVIDTSTNTVVATIPVGVQPWGVAVHPSGKSVYVVNGGSASNSVSVINTETNSVVATIPVGNVPRGISIDPTGSFAYVANQNPSNSVSVIDTTTNSVVATVPVGNSPHSVGNFVTFVGDHVTAYVANNGSTSNNVSVIRLAAISAPAVTLTSSTGNVSAATNVGAQNLTVNAAGDVTITERDNVTVDDSSAGGKFTLRAGGALSAGDIVTNAGGAAANGSIVLRAGQGLLEVLSGKTVAANKGDVTLESLNIALGTISIAQNATISALSSGSSFGRVYISLGQAPSSPVSGTLPSNVTLELAGTGQAFFGSGSIAAAAPENTIEVNDSLVVFDTKGRPASAISLGGGVTIIAGAEVDIPQITSLDLSDAVAVAVVLQLQGGGHVGGALQVSGGIAVGGDAIIAPERLSPSLTAMLIPANVTLTMNGFGSGDTVAVNLTSSSSSSQVVINGTQQFTGSGAVGNLVINSTESGPVLVVGNTGMLTSSGTLNVSAGGDVEIAGTVSAGDLTIATTAGNGDVLVTGAVSATSTLDVTVHGSGDVTAAAGILSGNSINLMSSLGNILAFTSASTVTANTSTAGTVFVTNSGSTTLGASSAGGEFRLDSGGAINVSGTLSAGSLLLQTPHASSTNLGANVTVAGSAVINAQGTGTISVDANKALTAGGYVTVYGNALTLADGSAIVGTGPNRTWIVSGGALTVTLPDSGSATIGSGAAGFTEVRADLGQSITFAKTAGAGTATLNFTGGPATTFTSGANTIINSGVSLSSDGILTVVVTGGAALQHNGSLAATEGVSVYSYGSPLTLTGSGSFTSAGPALQVLIAAYENVLNVNGSYTFNAGPGGYAQMTAATMNIAAATTTTATAGSGLALEANNLNFGAGATVTSNRATGDALTVFRYNSPMTVTAAAGSSATLSTAGGTISFNAETLTIASSVSGQPATLNLNGGPSLVHSRSGGMTVGDGLTIASNQNLTFQVHGGEIFTNDGTITSSASGGTIAIYGNGGLTLAGSPNPVTVTGGGSSSITVIGFDQGLTLDASYTFDAGGSGSVHIGAAVADLVLGAGKSLTATGGSQLYITASNLSLGPGTSITGSKTSGTAILINTPYTALEIAAAADSTATISTNGGSIVIAPLGGGNPVSFQKLGGGGDAVIDISGGSVDSQVLAAHTTIGTGVSLVVSGGFNLVVDGYLSNNGGLTNNGSILLTTGNLHISSIRDLSLGGTGSIVTNNGSVQLTGFGTIQVTHNIVANEGNLTVQNLDTESGTIEIGANSFLKAFTANKESGFGHATFLIGSGPAQQINTSNPDGGNITVSTSGGGQVYFGTNGIAATGSGNSIQGIGTNVTFDSGDRPGSAISLGGGVTIIADPPLTGAPAAHIAVSSEQRVPSTTSENTQPTTSLPPGERLGSLLTIALDALYLDFRSLIPFHDTTHSWRGESVPKARRSGDRPPELAGHQPGREDVSGVDLLPIAFLPGAAATTGNQRRMAGAVETATATLYGGDTARITADGEGPLLLHEGEAVICGKAQTVLLAGAYKVVAEPGVIALVSYEDSVMTVRALSGRGGDVEVHAAGFSLRLAAGQQVMVGKDESTVNAALNRDVAGRRRVNSMALAGGHHLVQSDVSLVSLARSNAAVRNLMARGDRKAIKAAERIVRTAACLSVVTGRHGAYIHK